MLAQSHSIQVLIDVFFLKKTMTNAGNGCCRKKVISVGGFQGVVGKANYNGIFQWAVQEMINGALMYLSWFRRVSSK